MAAIVGLSAQPATRLDTAALPSGADFAEVENVVLSRCSMCHAAEPLWEGVEVPPKGVVLETPGPIRAHAGASALQAVPTPALPPVNVPFTTDTKPQLPPPRQHPPH